MTKSFDLFQDRIGRCDPDERAGLTVVLFDESLDLFDELPDAAKGSPADSALGDQVKPDLRLVEPRGIRRRVVHVVAGARRQPAADPGMFVRGVVIDDEVNRALDRGLPINQPQELQPFFGGDACPCKSR